MLLVSREKPFSKQFCNSCIDICHAYTKGCERYDVDDASNSPKHVVAMLNLSLLYDVCLYLAGRNNTLVLCL